VKQPTRISYVAGKTTTQAFFDPQGEHVEFTLGSEVTIVSDPQSVLSLSANLAKLAREALTQKVKQGANADIAQVVRVVAASAQAPVGPSAVVIAFREATGIVQHFSLTPVESQLLRDQMVSAEKQAKLNRKKTIQ
jgi:hypothetical protein